MKFCLLVLGIFMFAANSEAAELFGADVGAFGSLQKITDDTESVQVGLTLEWPYIAVDMSTGIKRTSWRVRNEPTWEMNDWQSGSMFALRGYPFKNTTTIRPLITWVHLSDIFRGEPFNTKEEPTSDYVGIGVTLVWKRLELDISTGISGRECAFFSCDSSAKTRESQIQLRGYFWK